MPETGTHPKKAFVRAIQVAFALFGVPIFCFFLVLTLPVVFFAIPGTFIDNPLNGIFVLWWGTGGYAIYSAIRAILLLDEYPYLLKARYKTGIILGIVSFLPFLPLSLLGKAEFGEWVASFAFLGLIPAFLLLLYSFVKPKKKTRSCALTFWKRN